MFEQNVGFSERATRTLAGVVLLTMIFLAPEAPLRWFGLIGIVPLLTGLFGVCPFYRLLHRTTVKKQARS